MSLPSSWKRYALLLAAVVIAGLLWTRPRWLMNVVKRVEPSPEVGARLVEKYGCRDCHTIAGRGSGTAPNLDRVFSYRTEEEIRRWLENPKRIKPNTAMPNFHLSDSEIQALILFLKQVQTE